MIVRHGDTFEPGAPPRRIGARTDLPLVESGERQARLLRAAFDAAALRFERAWTSPLRRTRDTAATLLAGRDVAAETADWLIEIDHGPDEGAPESAVRARIGEPALAAWDRDAVPPPGWRIDAARRIADWRAALAERARHAGDALIVTSSGAARFALLCHTALACDARALPSSKLRTGAWGRLTLRDGAWRIVEWDRRP